MKTARFATVVEKAGKPEHHLTWADPRRDERLQKAAKQMRLLTLHQQLHGGKKDHGIVGLEKGRNCQYLIFPRSLQRFAGAKVVGIDYGAVDEKVSFASAAAVLRRNPTRPVSSPPVAARSKAKSIRASLPDGAEKLGSRLSAHSRPLSKASPPTSYEAAPAPISSSEVKSEISHAIQDLRHHQAGDALSRLNALFERLA